MKSIFAARRPRPERHPLDATMVWKEYQKAKEYQEAKAGSAHRKMWVTGLALSALAIVGAIVAFVPLRPQQQTIPSDAKARSEWVEAQGTKLSEEEKRALSRFLARVQAQESAGGAVPRITLGAALDRQRAYDFEVAGAQKRIQDGLGAAKASLGVNVRDQAVVKSDPAKSASGRSLRYVLEIANRDKRTVDAMGLRVEFRDSAGKYVAAIPTLELKGPLLSSGTGRSVQMLPLDARYHQYIIDGGAVQIGAYPTQVSYANGEVVDAEKELRQLESLARARIE
jgi:hypothetical protein